VRLLRAAWLILAVGGFLAGGWTLAGAQVDPQAVELLAQTQALYGQAAGFRADYLRQSRPAVMAQAGVETFSHEARGEIIFGREGGLRLVQLAPTEEEMIISPEAIWWYLPAAREAHCYPPSDFQAALSPIVDFFSGLGSLETDFRIKRVPAADKENWRVIDIIPLKYNIHLDHLRAAIDEQGRVVEVVLYSLIGDETVYRFNQIRFLDEVPAEGFSFHPPQGVKVIRH